MPRRKIGFAPGHFYHIYNRGVDRRNIFIEDDNYVFLLRKAKAYAIKFQIAISAYCLMPNHYHFLVRQDGNVPVSNYLEWIGEREGALVDRAFVAELFPNPTDYAASVSEYLLGKMTLPEDVRKALEEIEK